jgi:beta-lactamase class A
MEGVLAEFAAVEVTGGLHVRDVDNSAEVSVRADEPAVLASVVKVPLILEYARQVAAGQLDPTERVRVRAADRLGGLGTASCLDEVDIS